MCGRYTLRVSSAELVEIFQAIADLHWQPRFNLAPGQRLPILRQSGGVRSISLARWGFLPSWANDEKLGYKMINARSESIARSYRPALKAQRCLIPADGWYEWKDKIPFHFHLPGDQLFAFAGLWSSWRDIVTFTIFTTAANTDSRPYHDRMPVLLAPEAYDMWLDPSADSNQLTEQLLHPWGGPLDVQKASQTVGNVRNEGPDCLRN